MRLAGNTAPSVLPASARWTATVPLSSFPTKAAGSICLTPRARNTVPSAPPPSEKSLASPATPSPPAKAPGSTPGTKTAAKSTPALRGRNQSRRNQNNSIGGSSVARVVHLQVEYLVLCLVFVYYLNCPQIVQKMISIRDAFLIY